MKDKKHKLILEGNAFYEIDLTCLGQKEKRNKKGSEDRSKEKRQRN